MMNKIFLILILSCTLRGDLFTDTAKPLDLNRSNTRVLLNSNTKTTLVESLQYVEIDTVEGAMIVIVSEFEPMTKVRFIYGDSTKTPWIKCIGVNEPYTNRWHIGISKLLLSNTKSVEFEIITNKESDIEIQGIGLFLKIPEKSNNIDAPTQTRKSTMVTKPLVVSRSEWGARPPQSGYSNMPYYNKLTLHHSAGFSAENLEEGIAQMQAIQIFHQDVRGWSDIGYHFVIDKAGNIYQGRPETVMGAHTSGANTGNIGTCVLGCYHPPASDDYFCYDELSNVSNESIIKLFAWVSDTYNVQPNVLKGHRDYYDFAYTSCPGDNLWSLLPEIRVEIESYKNFGPTPDQYQLYQNFPNPFNNITEIRFDVIKQEKFEIAIYDILGRKIKSIANQNYSPGKDYRVFWDGKNNLNKVVSSGVYLCSIRSKNFKKAIRMVFLK